MNLIDEEKVGKFMDFVYENDLEMKLHQYSPYHFRIFAGINVLDIWPTSDKFRVNGKGETLMYYKLEEIKKYLR